MSARSKVPQHVIMEWEGLDLVDNRNVELAQCQKCVSQWLPPNHPDRLPAWSTAVSPDMFVLT